MEHLSQPDVKSGVVHNPNVPVKRSTRRANLQSLRIPLLVLVFLLGLLDRAFLHWGRGPLAAGVAMVIPIIYFRDLWTEVRFWIVILLVGVIQIPVVIGVRGLMEKLKFPFMLAFGILDCTLVAVVVSPSQALF
jgi:hypothetical protein